jgi:hypothetical protein
MVICIEPRADPSGRGLQCEFAAASFLGLRVQIPPVAWMSVPCVCCVLLRGGLYDEPLTSREEKYGVCNMSECVYVALTMRRS